MSELSGTWQGALQVGDDPAVESMAKGMASMSQLTLKQDGTFVLKLVDEFHEGTWVLDGRTITTTNRSIRDKGVLRKDDTVHQYAVSPDHARLDSFVEAAPNPKAHKLYFIRSGSLR